MKTLILLSAIAIIGIVGLECYENKPHSTFNAKTTNVSSKAHVVSKMKLFNPNKDYEKETDKTKLPCKACYKGLDNQGIMQMCLYDPCSGEDECCYTDHCNLVDLKMIRCFHGSSKTQCAVDCCYENECNRQDDKKNGNLQCYENEFGSVNDKTVSKTTVDKYVKDLNPYYSKALQDVLKDGIAQVKQACGTGDIECKYCVTIGFGTRVAQKCTFDQSACKDNPCCDTDGCNKIELKELRCYHGDSRTLVKEVSLKDYFKGPKETEKIMKQAETLLNQTMSLTDEDMKKKLKCNACYVKGQLTLCLPMGMEPGTCKKDSSACCYTDECNRIGGTNSDTNGNSNGNRNGNDNGNSNGNRNSNRNDNGNSNGNRNDNRNGNSNSGDQLNVNLFIVFVIIVAAVILFFRENQPQQGPQPLNALPNHPHNLGVPPTQHHLP